MRKFIVFIITAILIAIGVSSCGDRTDWQKVVNNNYDVAIENAKNIKVNDFPFFLGFKMGMNKHQVKAHADSLVTAKKLIRQGKKYIYYLGENNNPYSFRFEYINGELCEVCLHCESYPLVAESFALSDASKLREILNDNGYETYYYKIDVDDFHETLVATLKGNIEFSYLYESLYFTDLYRQEHQRQDSRNTLISDINM